MSCTSRSKGNGRFKDRFGNGLWVYKDGNGNLVFSPSNQAAYANKFDFGKVINHRIERQDRDIGHIDVLYPLDGTGRVNIRNIQGKEMNNQYNGAILTKNSIMIREFSRDGNGEYYAEPNPDGHQNQNFFIANFISKAAMKFQAGLQEGYDRDPIFPQYPTKDSMDTYFKKDGQGFLDFWQDPDLGPIMELNYLNRIRSIAYVAMMNGYDSIVLGALGCGAFNNDHRVIADLYYDVFVDEFRGVFKHIELAYMKLKPRDRWGYGVFEHRFINKADAFMKQHQ